MTPKKKSTAMPDRPVWKFPYQQAVNAAMVVFMLFLGWQMVRLVNKLDAVGIQTTTEQQNAIPLATQGLPVPTSTPVRIDPLKTPIIYSSEIFVYTEFEMAYRGGFATASCPYRWISVRNKPSISGNAVGCLPPYSKWNIEKPYITEGNNVWGLLCNQTDKYIALLYNGIYSTNWHEK